MDEVILVVIRKGSEYRRCEITETFLPDPRRYHVYNLFYFWSAETVVGYRGENPMSALSSKLDADPNSEAYKTVYKLVWRL
jgi:hypothetical protein